MDEGKLYAKVMGIEEARKEMVPSIAKIPKRARLSSSGGRCNVCGHETVEGHEDGHGIWYYRCTYCVANQKPSPDPCPRCRCTAHDRIAYSISVDSDFTAKKREADAINPFKPDVTSFRCLNCGFEWNTPEYEKYLLTKVIRSVLPTSEFANRKI